MSALFLSASVPVVGRGTYYETADPFLIQIAVRELIVSVVKQMRIVWGGHPAITPMVWAICKDIGVEYAERVILYQSTFFADQFPEENAHFRNVIYVEAVPRDREASLQRMREAMLSRDDLTAAVFIGGMEGVEIEYNLFQRFHPSATVLPVSAPGGAARQLAARLGRADRDRLNSVDFARLFQTELRFAN